MYPKIEAEPLKTHSQAEPGNERFSKLSRLMSMAAVINHYNFKSASLLSKK